MATQDDGGVSKKVAAAKKALNAAVHNPKVGTPIRPPTPPTPTPGSDSPAKAKPASSGLLSEAASAGAGLKAKQENVDQYLKASGVESQVPKMHTGGPVKEDGVKNLKKGEFVLPKEKAKEGEKIMAMKAKAKGVMNAAKDEMDEEKSEKVDNKKEEKAEHKPAKKSDKKSAKKQVKGMHVRRAKSGGFIAKHDMDEGQTGQPDEHVLPDMSALQSHVDDHMGGEMQESAPAPAASPAPAAL